MKAGGQGGDGEGVDLPVFDVAVTDDGLNEAFVLLPHGDAEVDAAVIGYQDVELIGLAGRCITEQDIEPEAGNFSAAIESGHAVPVEVGQGIVVRFAEVEGSDFTGRDGGAVQDVAVGLVVVLHGVGVFRLDRGGEVVPEGGAFGEGNLGDGDDRWWVGD